MKALLASILVGTALLCAGPAKSGVITIGFEDQTPGAIITTNLQIGRFRFSPNCHYDLMGRVTGRIDSAEPVDWLRWSRVR